MMDEVGEEENNVFEIFEGSLTEEEILSFAKCLGMHPVGDKDLLWFAEESRWFISRVLRLWCSWMGSDC